MSDLKTSPDLAIGSGRPSSLFTNDSVFADSAISVGPSTPRRPQADNRSELDSMSSETSSPTLSERLSNLAASAFLVQEDRALESYQISKIQDALDLVEECLEERVPGGGQDPKSIKTSRNDSEKDQLEEIQLHEIHASLASTVASMRQRQQEQRHIYQLTLQKLEAVAETCVVQRKQLRDLEIEIYDLRSENQQLGRENEILRDQMMDLESQATQKEVAVHAMSTAVSGLEGWINNSPSLNRYGASSTTPSPRRGRVVVRGQGRFRGRYFVDDPDGEVVLNTQEVDTGGRDLQEGVKSWVKGFRDVEEELHRASPSRSVRPVNTMDPGASVNEDWGEFQAVAGPDHR